MNLLSRVVVVLLAAALVAPSGSATATTPTPAVPSDDAGRLAAAASRDSDAAGELAFVARRTPLRNARAQQRWSARIDGLVTDAEGRVRFRKVRGADWVRVDGFGRLHGTPAGVRARTSRVVVEARDASGARARTTVVVDVRGRAQRLVPRVEVMSWNLWHGGTQVSGHLPKQLRFLLRHDVDVVGVQEGGATTARLASALGWHHHSFGGSVGVISRYPIVRRGPERTGLPATDVTVELDRRTGDRFSLWNVHLGYTPYGPYDACFGGYDVDRLMEREAESGRTGQITGVVSRMKPALRRSARTPVLLTGDFNAPSHLDWTARADRCGYDDGVSWPTSVVPTTAGLVDTFRVAHPDPRRTPGITWSPIYATFTGGYGHDEHTGEPEPQDRIDYVYAKGAWPVLRSRTLVAGDPAPIGEHADNEWTSDHAAVLTTLSVR